MRVGVSARPLGRLFSVLASLFACLTLATVHISAQSMPPTWVARYDGPAHSDDLPHAIAADQKGNVYVTGETCVSLPGGCEKEMATIKYDANGNYVWAVYLSDADWQRDDGQYATGTAITVDASENVYVAGYRFGEDASRGDEVFTAKYDQNGNRLWIAGYLSPTPARASIRNVSGYSSVPGKDGPVGIVVDGSGNVIITTFMSSTVTTMSTGSINTIKYDSNGNQQWVQTFASINQQTAAPTDIHLDAAGNIYVVGFAAQPNDFEYTSQGVVFKYDTNGNLIWNLRYFSGITASYVDSLGNVYLTGPYGPLGNQIGIEKIDYRGLFFTPVTWGLHYQTPGGTGDVPASIAVDSLGNIYVAGSAKFGTSGTSDYSLIKATNSGAVEFQKLYNNAGFGDDQGVGVVVNSALDPFITGSSMMESGPYTDIATIRSDGSPTQTGVDRYDGPAMQDDKPVAMVASGTAVYVTGYSTGSDTGLDWVTIKYGQ